MAKNKKVPKGENAAVKAFVKEFSKLYGVIENDSGDPDPAFYALLDLFPKSTPVGKLARRIQAHTYGELAEEAEVDHDIDPDIGSVKFVQFLVGRIDAKGKLKVTDASKAKDQKVASAQVKWEEEMNARDFQAEADEAVFEEVDSQVKLLHEYMTKNTRCVPGTGYSFFYDLNDFGHFSYGHLEKAGARSDLVRKYGPKSTITRKVTEHDPGHPHLWHSETKRKAYIAGMKKMRIELAKGHSKALKELEKAMEAWNTDGE